MKIEELDVDTGPICLATAACLRNALLYTSYVFLWNWQYVHKIKSLYNVKLRHLEG